MSHRGLEREGVYPIDVVLNTKDWLRNGLGNKNIARNKKRLNVFRKYGVDCVYCGIKGSFFAAERPIKSKQKTWSLNLYAKVPNGGYRMMTIDHVIPKSKGGPNHLGNLAPACYECNVSKSDTSLTDWIESKRFKPAEYPVRITDWRKLIEWSGWKRRLKWMWYNKKLPSFPTKIVKVKNETSFWKDKIRPHLRGRGDDQVRGEARREDYIRRAG